MFSRDFFEEKLEKVNLMRRKSEPNQEFCKNESETAKKIINMFSPGRLSGR